MATPPEYAVLKERLETLAGARRLGPRGQAAVRLDDLNGLLAITGPRSEKVATAPTASEFNALVADVHALHAALAVTINALRARRGR